MASWLIPVRLGFKSFGESGISWAVFAPSTTDAQILDAFDCPYGHYAGPGQAFTRGLCIRRTTTRVLVTQYSGLDV